MKKYILSATHQDDGILYLTLVPKASDTGFRFHPGQYATIGFRSATGRRSPMRCFSITSSATSEKIEFAVRLGGNFTESLALLTVGDEMYVQGPFGEFVQDINDRNVVMIAGGIGITPCMSMIRTSADLQSKTPMTLLYSCHISRDVPFYEELRNMEQASDRLRVILFVTNQASRPNSPRTFSGRMTTQHVEQVTRGEYAGSTYFVCGPKKFITDTESMLRINGVNDSQIISESFTQSSKVMLGGYNLRKVAYAFAAFMFIAGVGSIAALDLSRYIPNHAVTATATSSQTPSPATASSDYDVSNSNSDTSSTNPDSNTTPSTTSPTPSQSNYQAPITSVS